MRQRASWCSESGTTGTPYTSFKQLFRIRRNNSRKNFGVGLALGATFLEWSNELLWNDLFTVFYGKYPDGYSRIVFSPLILLWGLLIGTISIVGSSLTIIFLGLSLLWSLLLELPSDFLRGEM